MTIYTHIRHMTYINKHDRAGLRGYMQFVIYTSTHTHVGGSKCVHIIVDSTTIHTQDTHTPNTHGIRTRRGERRTLEGYREAVETLYCTVAGISLSLRIIDVFETTISQGEVGQVR